MQSLQKVIHVNRFKELQGLIASLADARAEGAKSVVLWAQGDKLNLLQEPGELELLERYARRFNLEIVLSAADNPDLRRMAKQLEWKVLWEMPGMEAVMEATNFQPDTIQWLTREESQEEKDWKVAG
jgi:hypothetical protein